MASFLNDAVPSIAKLMNSVVNQLLGPVITALERTAFIGVNTYVIKLDYVDNQIQPIADSLGMGLPLIKYTLSLFLAYPFAALLRAIPNKNLKHLVSMLGGIFLVQWVFGPDWIHSLISSGVTYLICAIAPRKYCPTLVFLWAMGYMTGSHVYRMYVSYLSGVFDFTGTQMVLTMKLTSFAYNLYDGTFDRKNVFPDVPHEDPRKDAIYADRRRFAITKLPNPLEFFGYIYCFTCLLAGPAFEYNDYVHAIDGSIFANKMKKGDDDNLKKPITEPSSLLPALQRLGVGVGCLGGHLYLSGMYPLSNVYSVNWIKAHTHLQRFGALLVTLFAERLKYYFAWKVAEGASILGGFGFQGYETDGSITGWSGVENIEIVAFETAPNVQTLSRAWNKRTQGWLERYTYLRSNRSLMLTYFVSAFWHGLYPGFFLFFMSIPVMTNIERLVKIKINPLVVPEYDGYYMESYPKTPTGYAYLLVNWVCTTVCMSYIVQVFPLGSFERCHAALGGYHYAPHVLLFVAYGILEMLPMSEAAKKALSRRSGRSAKSSKEKKN